MSIPLSTQPKGIAMTRFPLLIVLSIFAFLAGPAAAAVPTEACTQNGLSTDVRMLAQPQQRYYAALCAAYYLAIVEVTSDANAWKQMGTLSKEFTLDLTHDNIDPKHFKTIDEFNTYVDQVIASNKGLSQIEAQRRANILSQLFSEHFTEATDKGQRVEPFELLFIERALRADGFRKERYTAKEIFDALPAR